MLEPKELLKEICKIADSKMAGDIEILDIRELTGIADYFVIANANSAPQIRAIAEEIEVKMKEKGETPISTEGYNASSWLLLDYGDVVVHLFREETRAFYNIERLWSDAPRIDVKELIK